jgi:hypothetical protein
VKPIRRWFTNIRWWGLRTKIIAWSFVPAAIILSSVAWFNYIAFQQVTENLATKSNRELIELSAARLSSELGEYCILSKHHGNER